MMSELKEGTKFDQSKLRYSLLSPKAIEGLVKILEFGATKYQPYNWAKGITFSRVFSAMQRHLWAWWDGEENDPETGLNHMFHAMCNAMFLSHFVSHPDKYNDFDDRPSKLWPLPKDSGHVMESLAKTYDQFVKEVKETPHEGFPNGTKHM